MSQLSFTRLLFRSRSLSVVSSGFNFRYLSGNELGRGAGKGGGSGGSIREAGGSMGKAQAAKEEEYFRRLQREQLAGMQRRLKDEVEHHEQEIAHHLESIRKYKASIDKLDTATKGVEEKKH